jgi:hypothetical protein
MTAAPHVRTEDLDAAVDAGMLAQARATVDTAGRAGCNDAGSGVAAATAAAADTTARQGMRLDAPTKADWSRFGTVIPVLSASAGAGASVTAAVFADAAQVAGLSVLLVDTADPARSGLARASASDGPQVRGPHPAVRIRFSWRGQALLARAETPLPVLTPGMLPPPPLWDPVHRQIDVTIVDIGHDAWRVTAHPLAGAGAWLRPGLPISRPLLVVGPTIPGVLHAEQVLARLEPWVRLGAVTPPVRLIVVGARKWPSVVTGAAGRRVQELLSAAVFLPHDPAVALNGITADVSSPRLRAHADETLRRWNVLPPKRKLFDRRQPGFQGRHGDLPSTEPPIPQ